MKTDEAAGIIRRGGGWEDGGGVNRLAADMTASEWFNIWLPLWVPEIRRDQLIMKHHANSKNDYLIFQINIKKENSPLSTWYTPGVWLGVITSNMPLCEVKVQRLGLFNMQRPRLEAEMVTI